MNFIAGRVMSLVLFVLLIALMYYTGKRAAGGKIPEIRELPGLAAIEEGVGRCAEHGRPLHYSLGTGSFVVERTGFAMDITAGLDLLALTATYAAKYNVPILVTAMSPEVLAMGAEACRSSYEKAGRPELFKNEDMYYFPRGDYWQSGVLALFSDKKCAASYYIGPFWGEAVLVAEAGFRSGAFQVAGCARYAQIPFFLVSCEYTMIGEELFAAAAKASGDQATISQIQAQDITKLITLVLGIFGLICAIAGITSIRALLRA